MSIPKCNQCDSMVINGIYCHETVCPNTDKKWVEDEGEWVSVYNCPECGSEYDNPEDSWNCCQPVENLENENTMNVTL